MRTTLSLDDDVAAQLEQLRRDDPRAFKEIVNDLLRRGLSARDAEARAPRGPFTHTVDLGRSRLPDVDDVSEALAIAEGDDHA